MVEINTHKIGDRVVFPNGYFSDGRSKPCLIGNVTEINGRYITVKITGNGAGETTKDGEIEIMPYYTARKIF